MSTRLRAPVPHSELSLTGEGRGKCQPSVIKGYNCERKEETQMFENSDVVLQLYYIFNLISDSK